MDEIRPECVFCAEIIQECEIRKREINIQEILRNKNFLVFYFLMRLSGYILVKFLSLLREIPRKKFQGILQNSRVFPGFPGYIFFSRVFPGFPGFPGSVDTLFIY